MGLKSTRTWTNEQNGNDEMHTEILTDPTCVLSIMTFRMSLDVRSICDKHVNNIHYSFKLILLSEVFFDATDTEFFSKLKVFIQYSILEYIRHN